MPLGGYDIILWVNWMKLVSPVVFDFQNDSISVLWQQQRINLRQEIRNTHIKILSKTKQRDIISKGDACFLIQVMTVEDKEMLNDNPEEITTIIEEFQDVYHEPQGLPPSRAHDHRIPLQLDSKPIKSNPYKRPYAHKTEIEKIVKEMLVSGIIRHSSSPYASLVLLVRTKRQLMETFYILQGFKCDDN